MGLSARRHRERSAQAASAPRPVPQRTAEERLADRGAECARLRTENADLRKRVADLEQQIDTLTAPMEGKVASYSGTTLVVDVKAEPPKPQPEPAPQWQGKKRRG